MRQSTVTEAQDPAVALAAAAGFRTGKSRAILADSEDACWHFLNGAISHRALFKKTGGVTQTTADPTQGPVGVSGHAGITGNEEADMVARWSTIRATE